MLRERTRQDTTCWSVSSLVCNLFFFLKYPRCHSAIAVDKNTCCAQHVSDKEDEMHKALLVCVFSFFVPTPMYELKCC